MNSEFVTYVLFSKTHNKIYIGFTLNLISRFLSHNKLGKGFTAKYRPQEVVRLEAFLTKKLRCNEKESKRFYSRAFYKKCCFKKRNTLLHLNKKSQKNLL